MRNLDQLDLDILAHLFRDAGMTNKDLAALVGVAPSTCLERVRKLQQDGVLKGAHCEVDYQALGGHIQAMVSLQLARHSRQIIDAFRDAILALPEVISLFHMGARMIFWCTCVSPIPSTCVTLSSITSPPAKRWCTSKPRWYSSTSSAALCPAFPSHNGQWADNMGR